MQRHQPALLGGLFIGVISSLPIVGSANVCCCLWVVLGGLLTVYLQQQNRPLPVETGEAALGGLLAGLIGAVISVLVTAVMLAGATGLGVEERMRDMLDQYPQVPSETRDVLLNAVAGPSFFLLVAAVTVPVYAVFGMLGALLGLAIFRKKVPPAEPPASVGTPPTINT